MVVASSDKAYEEHKQSFCKNGTTLVALNPYDASKFCADILSRTYANTYKFPVAVTRCANIYGPGDLNFSRIIPDTCRAAIKGDNPIIKSDGTPLKDYAFVDDIVDAYFILADNLLNKKINFGEAFNFGTGKPVSVIELVKMILEISGKVRLFPKVLKRGKNKCDIDKQYHSGVKVKKVLGWKPKYSLKKGLEITYGWYKSQLS